MFKEEKTGSAQSLKYRKKVRQQQKKLQEKIRFSTYCIDEKERKIYNFIRQVLPEFFVWRIQGVQIYTDRIRRKDLMRGMDKIEERNDQVQKFYDF